MKTSLARLEISTKAQLGGDRPGPRRRRESRGDAIFGSTRRSSPLGGPGRRQGDRHDQELRPESRLPRFKARLLDRRPAWPRADRCPSSASARRSDGGFAPSFSPPGDHLVEVSDRRRPVDARQRSAGWPCRSGSSSTCCWSTATPRPSRSRRTPITWSRRSTPRRSRPRGSPSQIRTEVVNESQLGTRKTWLAFDAVVLCNVASVHRRPRSPRSTPTLKQGGGVVVFGGDQVVGRQLQPVPVRRRQGDLCPRRWWGRWATPRSKQAAFEFDARDYKHPILNIFYQADAPVIAGLTGAKTWQYHKLKIPEELAIAGQGRALVQQRRPGHHRGAPPPGDGDSGGHHGRHRMDHLAAPPELPADHGADHPPSGLGAADRTQRPGRPADRPGPPRLGRRRSRSKSPAPMRSEFPPSSSRPATSACSTSRKPTFRALIGPRSARRWPWKRSSPPTPTRPRATRSSSTALGLAEAVPGWNVRLSDQLERPGPATPPRSAARGNCTGRCSMPCSFC